MYLIYTRILKYISSCFYCAFTTIEYSSSLETMTFLMFTEIKNNVVEKNGGYEYEENKYSLNYFFLFFLYFPIFKSSPGMIFPKNGAR